MSKYKLHIDREQLWKGCVLNSIAHAINVAHAPDFYMKVHGMDVTIVCKIVKAEEGQLRFIRIIRSYVFKM